MKKAGVNDSGTDRHAAFDANYLGLKIELSAARRLTSSGGPKNPDRRGVHWRAWGSQNAGLKRRAPCRSTGRPALPLLPEGPDQHTVRKGDPPAGDQTLGPYGRRGKRPGGWWPEAATVVGASSPMVA
jgi:hypothetical protein